MPRPHPHPRTWSPPASPRRLRGALQPAPTPPITRAAAADPQPTQHPAYQNRHTTRSDPRWAHQRIPPRRLTPTRGHQIETQSTEAAHIERGRSPPSDAPQHRLGRHNEYTHPHPVRNTRTTPTIAFSAPTGLPSSTEGLVGEAPSLDDSDPHGERRPRSFIASVMRYCKRRAERGSSLVISASSAPWQHERPLLGRSSAGVSSLQPPRDRERKSFCSITRSGRRTESAWRSAVTLRRLSIARERSLRYPGSLRVHARHTCHVTTDNVILTAPRLAVRPLCTRLASRRQGPGFAPGVFHVNARPWVHLTGASTDEIGTTGPSEEDPMAQGKDALDELGFPGARAARTDTSRVRGVGLAERRGVHRRRA